MFTFSDRIVWVTGSSSGIGKAIALGFARHGADVIVHCNQGKQEALKVVDEITGMGRRALLVEGDVADNGQIRRMAEEIEKTFGRLDILVNNAGSMVKRARFIDLDEALWDRVMDVNLKSVFLVTKAAFPLLRKSAQARIINISSISARNGGGFGSIAYSTSKAGVSTFTRALAKDFAEYNITVNGIAPGVITTALQDRFTSPQAREEMRRVTPLGREGTPDETMGAALFLASPYADYMTGEIIEVNGGMLMD